MPAHLIKTLSVIASLAFAAGLAGAEPNLETSFITPPDAARPGVYWYFMDGNQDRDEMIADLNAMKDVGIGSVLFLEVNIGIPTGPVAFMSEPWQDNLAHAFVEAGHLGMEVILGTGPGWTGSGGSWVPIEDSMKHLVGSSVQVNGPGVLNQVLPVPAPHPANQYAGMDAAQRAERDTWFEDVAVIAFPTPPRGTATIGTPNTQEVNIRTLKDIRPYSSQKIAQRFVVSESSYSEPGANQVIDDSQVVDLTSLLQPDGSITWDVPLGDWTVMRFVARSTGQTTRPAPRTGHGFEQDKFDPATYQRHWNNYQQVLLDKIVAEGGPLQPGLGLTTVHLDSWEMSSQNWSAAFRQEFKTRRGYDPQPFYPAWMGLVVGSREETERFLFDMRLTSKELILEKYVGTISSVAHANGLLYSNQPYDMNPAGDIDLGSVADIPMCEFWYRPHDTQYGCIEAVSISHTMGQQIVKAEAFTSSFDAFKKDPANMKNQTDWALAIGINGFFFHTYQHQPLGPEALPGMTVGRYGIQWHRNNTLWEYLDGYHEYLTRCSHLLRQGEAVADILYLTPEGAPHIFEPPGDAREGASSMLDKKGHSFDAVTPRILKMRATVENGRIAFPGGTKYRVLVLPGLDTMMPETLTKIEELVQAGATVVGNPPVKSPSLVNYPACDTDVATLAKTMWGGATPPSMATRIDYGSGAIYWGGDLGASGGNYPSHAAASSLLSTELGLPEDFSSPSGSLRFIHRQTEDCDVYFVANRTGSAVVTDCFFRIDGLQPELWDPVTGETKVLEDYEITGGLTRVPMSFEPLQSFFVIFPHDSAGSTPPATPEENVSTFSQISQFSGAWDVEFDPALGGPASVTFNSLADWTTRPETGIRYYSGTGVYRRIFDLPEFDPAGGTKVYLDLGIVHDIARVRLNGQDLGSVWTAPWRVELTPALQATGNELVIEVANGWANRLIGDQQAADRNVRTLSWPSGLLGGGNYSAGRYTYATWGHYNSSSALTSAGLLGPVTLLTTGPDGFAPQSAGFFPADDSTTFLLPVSLVASFNETVAAGTGNVTIKNLSDSTQVVIDVTDGSQISFNDTALVISPSGGFAADKRYAIRIDPGAVIDAAGNPYAGIADDTTWNFTAGSAAPRVIIQDGFSGSFAAGNGAVTGRTPDTVNLPGNSYTEQQNADVQARMELDTATGMPGNGNSLKTGFNNSAHIRYSNTGVPVVPITLSIDAQTNTLADDASPRGIGLGFWSPLPNLHPGTETFATTHFTGILINPSGTLEYILGGASQGVFATAPAGFSNSSFLNLTYTVNPATGELLHLEYAGSDRTTDFATAFPANFIVSDTAGFLGSTATSATFFGRVDNFIVAASDSSAPLSITSLSPMDNATGVARSTDLEIVFGRDIMAGSGNITIQREVQNGSKVEKKHF